MKIDLHALRTELLEEELLLFGKKKIKRFASSGISGHSKSGRTQRTKLNGRGGMSFGPLRRDRRAVRVFAFTSCDSKNYDCLQPPVRKVLAFMLCRLTDVRHTPSEPPAKRTLADGDRRGRVRSAAAARCDPAVHDCHGRRSRQKNSLSIISHEKASQVFEEKELDKHRSCQAGGSGKGSGVDDWLCMNDGCSSTYWYTYTLGRPSNFFLYESQGEWGGGGESKQILREYGFKKTSKITDDP